MAAPTAQDAAQPPRSSDSGSSSTTSTHFPRVVSAGFTADAPQQGRRALLGDHWPTMIVNL